jgi:hypothetical protein
VNTPVSVMRNPISGVRIISFLKGSAQSEMGLDFASILIVTYLTLRKTVW